MAIWQPRLNADSRVKYQAIVDAIEEDIKARLIKPGDKLPSQRSIASHLNIDLTTVTRAIKEASRRGLVESQQGSGSYIAQTTFAHYNSVQLTAGKPIDLSMNNPPQPSSINLAALIAQTQTELSRQSDEFMHYLHYQETAGHPADREAAATWLSDKLNHVSADLILITSGAHSALFSTLSHLKRMGLNKIAAPELCYPGLRTIADYLAIDVCSIAMDASGIVIDDLKQVIKLHQPGAIYLTPNVDNPTTATLPLQRRMELVECAKHHQITLIEDDPYYAFLDEPLPSLYRLLPELTWHIATVSKCLSPALRTAYVAAPNLEQALSLAEEIRTSSIMAPPLMSAVVTEWMRNGLIDEIAEQIKQENQQRQLIVDSLFDGKKMQRSHASPHVWLTLPKGVRALEFAEKASQLGVSVVPSTAFVSTKSSQQALRVSLGAVRDRDALRYGLTLIADLYYSKLPRTTSII
jgi:DNA-binding transcriptional MocR family regulator